MDDSNAALKGLLFILWIGGMNFQLVGFYIMLVKENFHGGIMFAVGFFLLVTRYFINKAVYNPKSK